MSLMEYTTYVSPKVLEAFKMSAFQNGVDPKHSVSEVKMYKREPQHRVFVNRSLHLEKIKFFGFDMDYTIAVYKSPAYESMSFNMLKTRLVSIGYPVALEDFVYDPSFPVRGLWFDKLHGNLLKVDAYGNILVCAHGFKFLKPQEVEMLYPNKFIILDENRIFVLNTLFNLPETYMLACIVDYFANCKEFTQEKEGVRSGELYMSFKSIFQDVRAAMDWLHFHGSLKEETTKNLEKYIHADENLAVLFDRMRQNGTITLLITNSDYEYTNLIMQFLLKTEVEKGRDWTSFFDYIIVDARKPLFFLDGTILRKVDRVTGALQLGHHCGPLQQGQIYSGGSCDVVSQLIGAKGKDVLYIGDHIFGDILKSKKMRGWRTFLVVPELFQELRVWTEQRSLYNNLEDLEIVLGNLYKFLDSGTVEKPNISNIKMSLREVTHRLDMAYGMFGSLFRCGSRQTFFAAQVCRYADLYGAKLTNLLHYPFSYMFRAPPMLMPHESTVDHMLTLEEQDAESTFTRQRAEEEQGQQSASQLSQDGQRVPHLRANTPNRVTHYHDEGDSDDSDLSSDKSA